MTDPLVVTLLTLPCMRAFTTGRVVRDERGEGVISVAIAVLIVAALGVVMWVGFQKLFNDTQKKTNDQIQQIGN
jgi:mannitol-specific phosphotransferase system IIBC component